MARGEILRDSGQHGARNTGNNNRNGDQAQRDLCVALREHVALMTEAERRCVLAAIRQRPSAKPASSRPTVPAQAAQLALILE